MWLASKCKNGPIKCSIRYCSKYWNLTNRKLVCNTKLNLLKRYFRTKITLPPQVLSNTKDFDIYCSVGVQRNDRSRMFQMEKGTFHQICPVLSCSAQAQLNLNQPQIQHSNFCNNQQSIFWECNLLPQGLETRSGNSRIRNEKQVFPCFPCSGSLEVFRSVDVGHGLGWGWGWIMLWTFCDFHLDWGRALKQSSSAEGQKSDFFTTQVPFPGLWEPGSFGWELLGEFKTVFGKMASYLCEHPIVSELKGWIRE